MRKLKSLGVLVVLVALALFWQARHPQTTTTDSSTSSAPAATTADRAALPSFLPPEVKDTLTRIAHRGPFKHRQDNSVFGNREGLLPAKPRGYYHEYTVETPGLNYRGARRIITGGTPHVVYYYTGDHYRHFRRFEVHR